MMILAMMMVMTISANAMSYNAAKNEALFLSDKMAYELNLTAAQYEAVYEINLDYLMSLNGHADVFGTWWNRRNATEAVSSTHTRRYSLPIRAETAIVTLASTLTVTCRSPLYTILHLQCIIRLQHRLRITESLHQRLMSVRHRIVTWQ